MRHVADIVVAGAGPAGLAAAIHASRAGLRVAVLEPRPGVIDKACGEGIMPGGVEALATLGVRPSGLPFPGVRFADAVDPDLDAVGRFPTGLGLAVRRTVLHEAMRERAASVGVRFHEVRLASYDQRPDGVIVNGDLHARWLVAADGLRSHVRRSLGVERPGRGRPRLGLRRHYAMRPWTDHVEVYFGEGVEAYVTPVDVNLVGVAFLFEERHGQATAARRFDELLASFPILARHLADKPFGSRLRGAGPFEQRVDRRVAGNVLLVGDAAGYVDPLTGEGVALGLATAEAAIASILEGMPDAYESRYRRLTRRYFTMTRGLLAVARRRSLHAPMLRLARAMPRAFDAALGALAHLHPADDASPRPADRRPLPHTS